MRIVNIRMEGDRIYGVTDDGRTLWQSLLYYPRLRFASESQRQDYEIDSFGIHWEQIDEDISFESFEYPNPEPVGLARIFLLHPEINVTAFARRIGMKQSLLAAYLSGTKHPSTDQQMRILSELRAVAGELVSETDREILSINPCGNAF